MRRHHFSDNNILNLLYPLKLDSKRVIHNMISSNIDVANSSTTSQVKHMPVSNESITPGRIDTRHTGQKQDTRVESLAPRIAGNVSGKSTAVNAANGSLVPPVTRVQYVKKAHASKKHLTGVQKYLAGMRKQHRDGGSIALFSKDGHLSVPIRLNRYLKQLIGKQDRKIIRSKPYKTHDARDMILKLGNRPDYEVDKLSRYIDRRKRRLLARRLRQAKKDKKLAAEKNISDLAQSRLTAKLALVNKQSKTSSVANIKSSINTGLATHHSGDLSYMQNMIDNIKQATLLQV